MVSSLLADALANPTEVLRDLFKTHTDLDNFPQMVSAHFSTIFSNANALDEIPEVSIASPPEHHPDRALVRFRAMIQDNSPSPEIYLAKRRDTECGGWGMMGHDDDGEDVDYANLRECSVLWAVTIPGENKWCSSSSATATMHEPPCPHKFPIPGVAHVGAQIKVYEGADALKSAQLCTFVGILTSSDNIPTLHVLFSRPVIFNHNLPRITPTARDELINWIAESSLAGDRDAAEYIFLSAISRVHSKNPPILPLSITISRFPSPPSNVLTPTISHVLSQIFPITVDLPLTLQTLNSSGFAPESKNEDLHSGRLQLPPGTICILTEASVTEGTLSERGLANIHTIQEIINTQTLEYIFPFSRFRFNTDIAFILLTQGQKSPFFHTDVNITLNPSDSATHFDFYTNPEDITLPPAEKLEIFRSLAAAAKVGTVTINEEMAQYIQDDFVKERKNTASTSDALSSDDLIRRMMLARLYALSMQEAEITIPIWEKAKALARKSSSKSAS